jgi:hypothetical protein
MFGSSGGMYDDVSSTITPYFQPYVDAGTSSLGTLQEQLSRMYSDPGALYADLGQGFRASPGYEYNVNQATQAANAAAAAGGQLGSPAEQQALAQQVGGMADQDYQNYMNSMMGLYGQGVQGLTGLTGLGYQASSSLAEDLARAQMAQYGLDQAGELAKMQQESSMFATIGGIAGAAVPFMF